jgi:hypothetical protein
MTKRGHLAKIATSMLLPECFHTTKTYSERGQLDALLWSSLFAFTWFVFNLISVRRGEYPRVSVH